ncbi:hypothetical protein SBI_09449 [Streptomyces bingchenggensis BCW-1]|uniref:Uncharacterized protein n=1 Tax=Streptomyces bingchenggensis (strain BCW-1) TaxID=749414 RepID=D7C7L9_STRBB|nr:hypothetical protein SBI_09449 [Streptomyces bingchenggensis BCW-1]
MVGIRQGEQTERRDIAEIRLGTQPGGDVVGTVTTSPLAVSLRLVGEDLVHQAPLGFDLRKRAGRVVAGNVLGVTGVALCSSLVYLRLTGGDGVGELRDDRVSVAASTDLEGLPVPVR